MLTAISSPSEPLPLISDLLSPSLVLLLNENPASNIRFRRTFDTAYLTMPEYSSNGRGGMSLDWVVRIRNVSCSTRANREIGFVPETPLSDRPHPWCDEAGDVQQACPAQSSGRSCQKHTERAALDEPR